MAVAALIVSGSAEWVVIHCARVYTECDSVAAWSALAAISFAALQPPLKINAQTQIEFIALDQAIF